MDELRQDLRFAIRTVSKSPAFLLVAVLSLGMGIGANTAIFSLIDAVMLRALPVDRPDRLFLLTDPGFSGVSVETTEGGTRSALSYPEFQELRAHNRVFSGMFAAQSALSELDVLANHAAGEQSTKAKTQLVSGEFFGVLGVQPAIGRAFTPEEDQAPGASPLAVISYGFWQREFGSDTGVLGRTIRVGQAPLQIVGVAPEGFRGILVGSETDLWIPSPCRNRFFPAGTTCGRATRSGFRRWAAWPPACRETPHRLSTFSQAPPS